PLFSGLRGVPSTPVTATAIGIRGASAISAVLTAMAEDRPGALAGPPSVSMMVTVTLVYAPSSAYVWVPTTLKVAPSPGTTPVGTGVTVEVEPSPQLMVTR